MDTTWVCLVLCILLGIQMEMLMHRWNHLYWIQSIWFQCLNAFLCKEGTRGHNSQLIFCFAYQEGSVTLCSSMEHNKGMIELKCVPYTCFIFTKMIFALCLQLCYQIQFVIIPKVTRDVRPLWRAAQWCSSAEFKVISLVIEQCLVHAGT